MGNDEMRFYFETVLRDTGLSISGLDICDGRNGKETVRRLQEYDMIILGGGHVPTQNAFSGASDCLRKSGNMTGS